MAATLTVTSDTFTEGATMPDSAVSAKDNSSPHLRWSGEPEATRSFAVALHDPDAPTTVGYTHWIVFNLNPDTHELAAGEGRSDAPGTGQHGFNDSGIAGYDGMAPPPGDPAHRYVFTIYALDVDSLAGADATTTYPKFRFLIREHVLAEGSLTGHYAAEG